MSFIDQKSEDHAIDLAVEAAGMVIIVRAGAFKAGGEDLELAEDVTFTVRNAANNVWIDASIVREKATGEITVLVDEREADGVTFDMPYEFEGGPYEKLYPIFSIGIPSGTSDLAGLDLRVNRVVISPARLAPQPDPGG